MIKVPPLLSLSCGLGQLSLFVDHFHEQQVSNLSQTVAVALTIAAQDTGKTKKVCPKTRYSAVVAKFAMIETVCDFK
ncbi:MAG: hypothetical protein ACFB15_18850 [Cyclobacteriaceae bacterium]